MGRRSTPWFIVCKIWQYPHRIGFKKCLRFYILWYLNRYSIFHGHPIVNARAHKTTVFWSLAGIESHKFKVLLQQFLYYLHLMESCYVLLQKYVVFYCFVTSNCWYWHVILHYKPDCEWFASKINLLIHRILKSFFRQMLTHMSFYKFLYEHHSWNIQDCYANILFIMWCKIRETNVS